MAQPCGYVAAQFNEDDPKYKCLCQSCHSKKGTMIIAILGTVGAALSVIIYLTSGNIGGAFLVMLMKGLLYGCLFYGLNQERAGFLLPFLVWTGISTGLLFAGGALLMLFLLIILVVGGTGSLTKAFNNYQENQGGEQIEFHGDKNDQLVLIVIILVFVGAISGGLNIWFFTIVLACYRYLRDKASYAFPATYVAGQPGVVMSAPPPQGYGYSQSTFTPPQGYGYPQASGLPAQGYANPQFPGAPPQGYGYPQTPPQAAAYPTQEYQDDPPAYPTKQ